MLYFVLVAFLVVYFATVFGYTAARANDLGNWYWIADAIALAVAGVLSDRLLVRNPIMILGSAISLVGVGLFAAAATSPHTGYHTFAAYFILSAAGGATAYVAWRRHSPRPSRSTTRLPPPPGWRYGDGSSGSW
jgi:ACS family D-galactonate transporter-like MFS transporter